MFVNKALSVGLLSILLLGSLSTSAMEPSSEQMDNLFQEAISGDHRSIKNVARDRYRHPIQTLKFFQIKPSSSIVEIWPGGGWYTEILAPLTHEKGTLYEAGFATTGKNTPEWRKKMQAKFEKKLKADPEVYGHVITTELSIPEQTEIAPVASVDRVLTFRNVHNWLKGSYAEKMFEVMARALKPGGKLGVVEHRAKEGTSIEAMKKTGYMTESHVILLAEKAGLVLEARSEINANEKDSKDHPTGVWTLPPTLRYCQKVEGHFQKAACLKQYTSIGESDRMTLLFRKPE